jgi:hypothetical protein
MFGSDLVLGEEGGQVLPATPVGGQGAGREAGDQPGQAGGVDERQRVLSGRVIHQAPGQHQTELNEEPLSGARVELHHQVAKLQLVVRCRLL